MGASEGERISEWMREAEQFRSVVTNVPGIVYRSECREPWRMFFISDYVETLLGFAPSDFLEGRSLTFGDLLHPEDHDRINALLEEVLGGSDSSYAIEYRLIRSDRNVAWVEEHARVTREEDGRPLWLDGIIFDVARRKAAEDARDRAESDLRHQALHDPLTGLANRALLLDRLEHALVSMDRHTTRPAVIFLDLDYFKSINDASGHSVGDQVLVEVARRLQSLVRPMDTIARLGGDEFILLCEELTDPLAEAAAVWNRITAHFEEPFVIEGREIFVGASAGVAPANAGDTAEAMVARADQAMYRAKELGRGRAEVYDPAIDQQAIRRAEVATVLPHALGQHQLHVVYQPVVDLHANRTVAREALLRWTHPSLGNVLPDDFIPVAEETGLIVPMGRWVLGQACQDCGAWRQSGTSDVGVAVNVSGRQLRTSGFEDHVIEALSNAGLAPGALTLEITESLLMAGRAESRGILERLRSIGVRIAIDDFGTGYSSLSWLARLPLDIMKVDRSFISSLGLFERESGIVKAMIHLAHTLGLTVVAEGVETDSQFAELTNFGCDAAQGYLLGYPEALRAPETAPHD